MYRVSRRVVRNCRESACTVHIHVYRPRDVYVTHEWHMHTVLDVRAQCYICLSIVCMCTYICHIHRTAVHTLTCMQDHIMDTRSFVCVRGCARVGMCVCVCVCVCDCYLIDAESYICDL